MPQIIPLTGSVKGRIIHFQNLQDEDMMYVGSYESWEDYNTNRIIEANGISIGFLNYSYGTNGIPVLWRRVFN